MDHHQKQHQDASKKKKPRQSGFSSYFDEMDPINWSQLPDTAVINMLTHLSHKDRAQASSTCKRWRDCYFHPSFWRRVDVGLSVKTGCEPARCILEKSGKFVRELILSVDLPNHRIACGQFVSGDRSDSVAPLTCSDEFPAVIQPDDLSRYKSLYQELPKVLDGLCRSQGLEKLIMSFFPQCENSKCPLSPGDEFMSKMTESLNKVIQASSKLKKLALGLSISCSLQAQFLKELSEKFGKQLGVLHIPAFTGTDYLSETSVMTSSLKKFTSLSVLTLNMALVTNQLFESISSSDTALTLRHLNMVTGYGDEVFIWTDDAFIWTDDACWEKLARRCPDIRITLSVVISTDVTTNGLLQYLTPSIPLTSLRILVCHPTSLKVEFIEKVAKDYCKSLCRLELHTNKATQLFGNEAEADPLVMLCWKCKKLNHIVITGYKLLACNILAVALLRGPSLATFEVERELIYHYDDIPTADDNDDDDDETPTSYDSLTSETGDRCAFQLDEKIQEISKSLKRPWAPVERQHVNIAKFLTHDLYIDSDC